MTAALRQTLRLFLWARAQHLLWQGGQPVVFVALAERIAADTGLDLAKVRAALCGGFSSAGSQAQLARWCGLRRATKHGAPVLVPDLSDTFDRGPGRGVAPCAPEDLRQRLPDHLS
ncbi:MULTISPECIES: hypothetical protein [unclassified Roseibium]|uniref:hypothetical protein n=1 Tax=unclassified Roseibium TaxID=2629323 RepID=UPI00273D4DA6|nr:MULTISPECIES: hypothetical protein [unclassified Roseibium]